MLSGSGGAGCVAPEDSHNKQKNNGDGDIFMQGNDITFKAAIDAIT